MRLTPHHARYFAYDLTRRATSGMDRLSMALFDAAVDLNPHQIEDEIMEKRDQLIESLERRLAERTETVTLFTICWAVE